jgi:hypothetical protein
MSTLTRSTQVLLEPRASFANTKSALMVEILVPILQLLVEFVLQMLVWGGLDFFSIRNERGENKGCMLFGVFLVLGGLIGGIATWIHPQAMLAYPGLRLANLIVGPFLAGGLSWLVARWRKHDPLIHVLMAFSFVLGYNVVRFAFARP